MTRAWKPIKGEIKRKVLVTNNIKARDAHGNRSHVWIVSMVHEKDNDAGFTAFIDNYTRLWDLTHYAEIPE